MWTVEGSADEHPEAVQTDAVAGVLDALVVAVNSEDAAALSALLGDVEDPQGQVAALIADRQSNGEVEPGQVAVLYPADPDAAVDVSVAVWRLPASGGPEEGEGPLPWVRLELAATGAVTAVELTSDG